MSRMERSWSKETCPVEYGISVISGTIKAFPKAQIQRFEMMRIHAKNITKDVVVIGANAGPCQVSQLTKPRHPG